MKRKLTAIFLFLLAFANAGLSLSVPRGSVPVDDESLVKLRAGDNKVCSGCWSACDSSCSRCNAVSPPGIPGETTWQHQTFWGEQTQGYWTNPGSVQQVNRTVTPCNDNNINYYGTGDCSGVVTFTGSVPPGDYYLACANSWWPFSCNGITNALVCP